MADNNMLEDFSSSSSSEINIAEEEVKLWQYSHEEIIIVTIIIPIILSLGVINNSAFLFVIFRVPTMRSATNIYLAHLALADLLYLTVTSFVYNILTYAASPHVAFDDISKSSAGCFIFGFLKNTGYFASIALVTMVSFERYLAVCHTIKHLKIRRRRRTNTMVAICWVVGLIFACSTTPGTTGFIQKSCINWPEDYPDGFSTNVSYCGPLTFHLETVTIPLTLVPWLVAMISNVFMYIRIIYALNRHRSATFMKGKHHTAQQRRNKVAQVLIINGAVFFICQTPSVGIDVNLFYHRFRQTIKHDSFAILHYKNGTWFSTLPLLINTIVNPLIYAIINAQCRSAFVQAFRRNTGSGLPKLVKNFPAVSPEAMTRPRNSTEAQTNATRL